MSYLGIMLGLVMGGAALYGWFAWHRKMTRGDGPDIAMDRGTGGRQNRESLEEFIAAYRRGEAPLAAAPAPARAGGMAAGQPAATLPSAPPVARGPFLSGPVKLAYHICKAGLRDHHVFAHVPMAKLSAAVPGDPALARSMVPILICNAEMTPVAVIEVVGIDAAPDATAPDPAKVAHLRALGIRYLRLSAKTMPRPETLHALIYRA